MSEHPPLVMQDVHRTHLTGDHQVHALAGVSLTVQAGELVAVVGPSGSGKSTLLSCAGGMDMPTAGTVTVNGADLADLGSREAARMRRRHIGYVFQSLNLLPSLTAGENVALPLELDKVPMAQAREAASAALASVALEGLEDRYPAELSGGQQQRVAIARAVVGSRRLILADEPTGALDTSSGDSVISLLRTLCDAGAACVLVTHNETYAARADRTMRLLNGRAAENPPGRC